MATVVIGAQWGDEGKGKLVDILCDTVDVCARCQGGNNAGHTIVAEGIEYDFHILPSGLVNPKCLNLIGSGVVVHVPSFFKELQELESKGLKTNGRIFISDRAHVVFDLHQKVDGLEEVQLGAENIGTTRKGIGPCYSAKAARSGVRMAEIFHQEYFEGRLRKLARSYERQFGSLLDYDVEEEIERFRTYRTKLATYVIDAIPLMTSINSSKKRVLVEGANAIMLDIDYGTYPFVTSSNTGIGGVFTGLGLSPFKVETIIGVVKAYTTRVGSGPMPSEQLNEIGEKLQRVGREVGVTTGRKRRCGWLDLVVVKYSAAVNHYTSLNLTKLDILDTFTTLQIATSYSLDAHPLESFPADLSVLQRATVNYTTLPGWETPTTGAKSYYDLPKNARAYVEFIEGFVGVKVKYIGIGPGRENMITR
ncbi:hypothetical protein FGG08_007016 [Glutinoglossum americanum]|uniref:Adenylosuccinate synthetase n=1 Tax=Glutinoglossum americanum TaxID=1670608 RepID=A0A9P8KZT1_9PEZI|nr:hypothetical protein FGG08_007016 [Glutinoglossum americanum]